MKSLQESAVHKPDYGRAVVSTGHEKESDYLFTKWITWTI